MTMAPSREPTLATRELAMPASADAPAWPKARRPLSIAILGWARMSSQQFEGSGYNLNKSELARGLVLSGHRVAYLRSGMTYRAGALRLGPGRPAVRMRETWGGVDCWELENAPNAAPAALNFQNMAVERESPETVRLVLAWLDRVAAEVVHIHSLEGYSLDVVAAIERSGRPVVITPHNYWYACPQVDLLHKERSVCTDYDGGRRCVDCLPGVNVAKLKRMRALGQSLETRLGLFPADVIRKAVYGLPRFARALARGQFSKRFSPPIVTPDRLIDPELAAGFQPARADTAIAHHIQLAPGDAPRDYEPSPVDQNQRVLANRDKHLTVLNNFGERRRDGLAALAAASLVTPPSDYLRKVHVAMGVPEHKTRWVRLGQPHFDQINRRARRSPFYSQRPWSSATATRPLRFAFLGTTRPNKGLEILVRAIELLDPALRAQAQFIIRAQGNDLAFRKRLAKFPEVSVWGGFDLYQLIASAGEYDVGILPHIWLENSPLVLLENLHAGKFVISSKLGGPVDWIREPDHASLGNGLLFPGGDHSALARCIERCIRADITLPSPEEVHRVSTLQSFPDHVSEVASIYAELLEARARASPAVSSTQASR
jgi:glycosyltransferase involved in cell wall biosynthesis